MLIGFRACAGNGVNRPPRACNSLTSEPPRLAISALAPARLKAAAVPIAGSGDAARLEVGDDLQHGDAGEGMCGPVTKR